MRKKLLFLIVGLAAIATIPTVGLYSHLASNPADFGGLKISGTAPVGSNGADVVALVVLAVAGGFSVDPGANPGISNT